MKILIRGLAHDEIAPVVALDENLKVLELFHGPTLAFKDFALQLLGNLYEEQINKSGRIPYYSWSHFRGYRCSGNFAGLLGKKGVTVFILYFRMEKFRPLQERQMTCTESENVFPLAIEGTFDDAQRAVKEIFSDLAF